MPDTYKPIVLFDGVCNFCNGAVNFIIRQDDDMQFRFAALQSDTGQQLLQQYGLNTSSFNSFVLVQDGKVYTKSAAALKLYGQLGWYWKWTQIFWIVPSFIRNAVYDVIAKNRYKLFGKKDACMIPTPEVRNRFLG